MLPDSLASLGCLSCMDLLSVEITCEGNLINKVCMKNDFKDAFVTVLNTCRNRATLALSLV